MKFFATFFLFSLQILLLITPIQSQDNNSSNATVQFNFLYLLGGIFEQLEPECFPELNETLGRERAKFEKDKKYPWLLDAIGKGINDIGDETECLYSIKENTSFIMTYFHDLDLGAFLGTDQNIKNFLGIRNFTYGICIMYSCRYAYRKYMKILAKFINYVNNNITSNDSLVNFIESNRKEDDKDNIFFEQLETTNFKIFFVAVLIFLIAIKIIGALIRIVMIPKGYNKYVAEKIIKLKKLDKGEDSQQENNEEKINLSTKNKFNELLNEDTSIIEYNPLFDFSEKLPKFARILRVFDIINDYKYLTYKRNRYFNDSNLEILTFNRAFVIFSLIFSNTFTTLISLPSEEIFNSSFFSSWMNIFYRLTNNALTCWIFLEGAYTTYKLLSFISTEMFIYLKKEDKENINFKIKLLIIYGKFAVLLIPKFIEFILIYFIIYYRVGDYRFTSSAPATFTYIIENILNEKISCHGIFSMFDSWFSNDIKDYDACYEFTYFYINMILSIFIFMIISYLFFIIQNKIFEFVIIGINLILFLFSILLIKDEKTTLNNDNKENIFLEYHIIGQTYTSKYFLSFISFFHLGFIFGFLIFNCDNLKHKIHRLIYEYNKGLNLSKTNSKINLDRNNTKLSEVSISLEENLTNLDADDTSFGSRNNTLNNQEFSYNEDSSDYYKNFTLPYYPLRYIKQILIYINKLTFTKKILIILGGLVLLIIIDLLLLTPIYSETKFDIKLDGPKIFMFKYEKHFFIIIYFLMNAVLLTIPKKSSIRNFMSARIFIATSRIGFLITCVIQALTYISFLIFVLKVKLYVPTFALISIGNFLVFFIVCSIFTIILELPLRIVIKKLLRIERNKERTKENITI